MPFIYDEKGELVMYQPSDEDRGERKEEPLNETLETQLALRSWDTRTIAMNAEKLGIETQCFASRPETKIEVEAKLREYLVGVPEVDFRAQIHALDFKHLKILFMDRFTCTIVQAQKDCDFNYLVHALRLTLPIHPPSQPSPPSRPLHVILNTVSLNEIKDFIHTWPQKTAWVEVIGKLYEVVPKIDIQRSVLRYPLETLVESFRGTLYDVDIALYHLEKEL